MYAGVRSWTYVNAEGILLTGRVPYDQPENSLAMFNDWLARLF